MNPSKREGLEKKLLKEAYELGVEVGYHGHSEVVGQIGRKRYEIFQIARKIGLADEARIYYQKGKEEGKQRKARDLWEGKASEIERKKMPAAAEHFVTMLDGEYSGAVKEPEVTQEPTMTHRVKSIGMPRALEGFRAGLKKPR